MSRTRYIARRLFLALLVLISVSIVTFVIARVVPSNPAALYAGQRPTQNQIELARQRLGLDRPLYVQYLSFLGGIVQGDFGVSLKTRRPILQDIRNFLPATLELVIASSLIALIFGVAGGVFAGARPHGAFDQISRFLAIAGAALPTFWLALMLQLIFFRMLHLLPLTGRVSKEIAAFYPIQVISGFYMIDTALTGNWVAWRDAAWHLVLPAFTLSLYPLGLTLRMTRSAMTKVLSERYIMAARAQGIPERTILFRLALKNAIAPTLTVIGLTFVYALTGAFLVEIIFSWPGLGRYVTDAVMNVDFPVIVTVTLLVTVAYVVVNLLIDLIQVALDPRVVLR